MAKTENSKEYVDIASMYSVHINFIHILLVWKGSVGMECPKDANLYYIKVQFL